MAESKHQQPMNDDPLSGELLSAYLDGELTAEERSRVEASLRDDEQARELLEQLRSTSEALQSLPRQALGVDLHEQVLSRALVQPRSTMLDGTLDYNSDPYEANDHGSGRRVMYAAAAIAAALLLMFYQGGENPASDQLAMSGDKARRGASDAVIRSANPENTQIAGIGALGAMFSSLQSKLEPSEPELGAIPSPNIELIGEQLLGDAPLEHLHVLLKPKADSAEQDAFARLLEDTGVTQMNSPASAASSDGYRARMVLVDAPLLQIRQILLHCQRNDSAWKSVSVRRQSDAAPALSFFAAEEGALEALARWLSLDRRASSSWALYLGSGTEAVVHSEPAVAAAEDKYVATDSSEVEPGSEADSQSDSRFDALRGNLRVLFILLPADE